MNKGSCIYLVVWLFCSCLVLVGPGPSLYSASPLKHHVAGMQWCPNPDHYPDSELASWSLTLMCWALSRAAEPLIWTSFFWFDTVVDWTTNLPHARQMLKLLHYPAMVMRKMNRKLPVTWSYSSKNLISILRLKQNVLPGYNVKCWKSSFLMWTIGVDSWYRQLM